MYQSVLDAIKARRSVRAFTDQPIARAELEKLVEAGRWAPTGKDRQSFRFTVLTDREKIQDLARAVALHFAWTRGKNYNFYDPVALILVSNERENTNGLADCSCALQNIFLMASELGIGSCWINQLKYICDEEDIRPRLDALRIPGDHIVWGMAALGYPAKPVPAEGAPRKSEVVYID